MASTNVVARSVNELSLAAWFGGSLFGSLASARAGAARDESGEERAAAWDAWRPVEATAVVAQLVSGTALTIANRRRVVGQSGVGVSTLTRMALTGAATAATVLVWRAAARQHSDDFASERKQAPSATLRWSVPVLTGSMLVLDAWMGEQQRPASVVSGVLRRIRA